MISIGKKSNLLRSPVCVFICTLRTLLDPSPFLPYLTFSLSLYQHSGDVTARDIVHAWFVPVGNPIVILFSARIGSQEIGKVEMRFPGAIWSEFVPVKGSRWRGSRDDEEEEEEVDGVEGWLARDEKTDTRVRGEDGRGGKKGKKARNELLYYVLVEKIYQSSSLFDLSPLPCSLTCYDFFHGKIKRNEILRYNIKIDVIV